MEQTAHLGWSLLRKCPRMWVFVLVLGLFHVCGASVVFVGNGPVALRFHVRLSKPMGPALPLCMDQTSGGGALVRPCNGCQGAANISTALAWSDFLKIIFIVEFE